MARLKGLTRTKHPGVLKARQKNVYVIRVKVISQKTGRAVQKEQQVKAPGVADAARQRAEILQDLKAGPSAVGQRKTLGGCGKLWLEAKARIVDSHTAGYYLDELERLFKRFGNYYVDALTTAELQEWVNSLKLRARTVGKTWKVIRPFLRWVCKVERLPDVTDGIILPDVVDLNEESKGHTPEEAAILRRYLTEQDFGFSVYVRCRQIWTARHAHVAAVKWTDWDEKKQAYVPRRRVYKGTVTEGLSKNKRARPFYVTPELAELLREHRRRQLEAQVKGLEEGWIFPGERGGPLSYGSAQDALERAFDGLAKTCKPVRRITIHGLRYTGINVARQAGVDPRVSMALAGHTTERQHQQYNDGIGMDEMLAAVAAIDSMIESADPGADPKGLDGSKKHEYKVDSDGCGPAKVG